MNNTIVSKRTVNFPRALVWRAWTEPDFLAQWWGPKDFTNTFHEFNFVVGGDWRFTMHAPDGGNFENLNRFEEIHPFERIVFKHIEPVHVFRVIATFTEEAGQTAVVFQMIFDEADECERVRKFIEPANEQNLDRLEAVLHKLKASSK